MANQFFSASLQQAGSRIAHTPKTSRFLLDKNEQSEDVPESLKNRVLESLLEEPWNRYPAANLSDIEEKVAGYCGLQAENIVLGAGSAGLITTLLNYFALNHKKIIINQPTYSLFDYHCKTYNIPYTPWMLTDKLEFDLDGLPAMGPDSVLILTSPNNPVGNTIDVHSLESLLRAHPESLVILDAVYCEFSDSDFTPLVERYPNLIVLRSFSKAFPVAGLRLGYLCAQPAIAAMIRKLVLPFSISPLTLVFARQMLFEPEFQAEARKRVRAIVCARKRMIQLFKLNFDPNQMETIESEGNFLLLRFPEDALFSRVLSDLDARGIKVLNTSVFPLLRNTLRVSIGNRYENEAVFNCLKCVLHGGPVTLPQLSFRAFVNERFVRHLDFEVDLGKLAAN